MRGRRSNQLLLDQVVLRIDNRKMPRALMRPHIVQLLGLASRVSCRSLVPTVMFFQMNGEDWPSKRRTPSARAPRRPSSRRAP